MRPDAKFLKINISLIIKKIILVIVLFPAITLAQISFTEHIIVENFNQPWSVYAIDMDNDQDIDVVGSARLAHRLAWWENDGSQSFTYHSISNASYYAMSVSAADMDEDNDIDILCASQTNGVELWINQGDQTFVRQILGSWPFSSYLITDDIDSDQDIDVAVACCEGGINRMGWIENLGHPDYLDHIVASNWDHANSVHTGDINLDNHIDLIGSASQAGEISWFENDGFQNFSANIFFQTSNRPSCAIIDDIDNDNDMDVVATLCISNQVIWFENEGSHGFTSHIIGANFFRPHSVLTADLDNDQDIDIVAAAINGNQIAWWENLGNQTFKKHVIISSFSGATGIFIEDIDKDGDLDVLGTAQNGNKISWFENLLLTGVKDEEDFQSPKFNLNQNYPNPFNPRTRLSYQLKEQGLVTLTVHNLLGENIATLVNEDKPAGSYNIEFDASNLPSGIYYYTLKSGTDNSSTKKMLLLE